MPHDVASQPDVHAQNVRKACRGAFISVVIFSFVVNILMLTGPLFMLQVYDRVLASGSIPTLVALVVLVVFLYLIYGVLEFVRSRLMARVGRRTDEVLRDGIFDVLMDHALRRTPGVGTRPAQDLAAVRQFLGGSGPFSFLDMPWSPVYLAVIFMLHFWLGVAASIATAILLTLAALNDILLRRHVALSSAAVHASSRVIEESADNVEVVAALGMKDRLKERWLTAQSRALESQGQASDLSGMLSSITRTLRLMFQSGILAVGAYLAVKQEISPGTMIAASIIMARALAPMEQAFAHWQGFVSARRAWRRISELLRNHETGSERQKLPDPAGKLSVKGLTAMAPGADQPLVFNISFELPAGGGLGIIGPTGAGKSTLAQSLIGLWPYTRGEVRLDGAELNQWHQDALGRHIGYLPQEVQLFNGSIAQNISRFDPAPNPDDIIAAAQNANAHDVILQLPEGYDTVIGETKIRLSAGQRQRIGLARALYGGPALIVLDEPNANLDAEGEAALIKAIAGVRERKQTVIVVAHRPSAIASLDLLMMIKDGRIQAFGPKDEVLSKVLVKRPGQRLKAAE